MASDLQIQGEVVVNSEKAESAFDRVGDKAQQMANEVATSANKAGQAVDKIGDGAGASAEKFTRAEARMRESIKRSTQELQLLGKTASEKLEFNIQAKGLDAAKFAPYIEELKKAEEAQRIATSGIDRMGMSAKATAAAMRQVPAQFQDIIVSLQGGQAPMTVLLQQGSQLTTMFGGIGGAAKALGTYVAGLVNPFTVAAAAAAALGVAMYSINSKDAALRELSVQLIGTGRASISATEDIKALVEQLNVIPGVSKASATAIITEFAKVSGVGADLFRGLGSSVADFAAATGTDLPTAAKKLAEAFADPAKGAKTLEESLGTLTAAQLLTIEKMAEVGNKTGAQAALMDALKQATSGLAEQGMTPLGKATDKLSNAWDTMTTSVGNSSAFRTANDWLAKLITKVAELTTSLANINAPSWLKYLPGVGPAIGVLGLIPGPTASGSRSVSGRVGTSDGGASGSWDAPTSDVDKQVKAALDATKSYESQAAAMDKLRGIASQAKAALKALEDQNRGTGVEAAALRERIAGVNEKLAEMAKKGQGDAKTEQSAYASLLATINEKIKANEQEAQAGGRLNDADKLRIKLNEELEAGAKKLTAAHQASLVARLSILDAQEREKDLIKRNVDLYKEQAASQEEAAQALVAESKAREAGRQAITSYVAGIEEANAALQLEVSLVGATDEQRKTALERLRIELDLKKQIAAINSNLAFDEKQREEERARATSAAAIASSNASTRVVLDQWQRTADSINNSLTDALLRGFESGKSFAQNLRDTLVNMFKTLVLRPIISFVINPIGGMISSAITGGLSALGIGGSGLGSMLSMGGSLLGNVGSWLGIGGGAAAAGAGLAATTGAGLSLAGAGTGLGLTAGAGTGLGLASAGGGLGITGASAGAGTIGAGIGTGASAGGISGALASVPMWGWALAAGALLSKLAGGGETRSGGQFGVAFDGAVTNNRRGETYTYQGQQYDRDFSNGRRDALVNGQAYRLEGDPLQNEQAIRDAVAGTASGIGAMLKALGSSATLTGFSAGLETSSKGRGGVFAGGTLSNGATFGESGKGDNYAGTLYEAFSTNSPDFKTALENFTLDLKQSTIQALQSVTDIPEAIKKQLEGVDAEALTTEAADALLTSINAQIVGVQQFRGALDAMGLEQFADMAFDTASAIAEAAGGFDALQSSLAGYYENYYSESEKAAQKTKQVKDALAEVGLEMPKTREEFREMLEANLALGESGAEAAAALLGVQDEFASLTPKVETLADAFAVSGDMIKGILDDAIANASSAAEASQMASDAFVEGMYSSLQDAMTTNLSGLIMGAIQPMVDALIAGATTGGAAMATGGAAGGGAVAAGGAAGGGAVAAGGATAGAVMAGVLEQAKAQISAWATILSDPEVQAMIGDIGSMIGGVAGVAYEAQGAWNGGAGSGFVSPGSSFAGGAQSYQDALKSIGDTIEDEVKRLRGLMVEDSPFSKDVLLAQFATATAQARAGDKDALAKLPDLSKAIEAASAVTAVSAVEMARTRGWLAGSLEETLKALGLTGAGGVTPVITPTTPSTTPTTTPPNVITPIYNPAISGATMDPALLAAVKDLSQKLTALMTNDEQNHEEAQSMRLRVARSVERLEAATVLQP